MSTRTPDSIDQEKDGWQQSVYLFGSSSSKLDVSISEALIDSGDIIKASLPGGEAIFTNDDVAETVYIKMYAAEAEEDWSSKPERFSQVGDEIEIGPDESKMINWESRLKYLTYTKRSSGAITGGLYGTCRNNGYDT